MFFLLTRFFFVVRDKGSNKMIKERLRLELNIKNKGDPTDKSNKVCKSTSIDRALLGLCLHVCLPAC